MPHTKKIQLATEKYLIESALTRIKEITKQGTATIEIKSGYGLNVENELKMLRVIKQLKALVPHTIKATFLGAHTFPFEFKENHQIFKKLPQLFFQHRCFHRLPYHFPRHPCHC